MYTLEMGSADKILTAQEWIKDIAKRTPLIRLNLEVTPAENFLKLENLQPVGSIKI